MACNKRSITFLVFGLAFALLFLLTLASSEFASLMHALNRAVYSGYSKGKLIVSFAWFILLPILTSVSLYFRAYKYLCRFELVFLAIFLSAIISGFILGALQFKTFASGYRPRWMFATIIYEDNYRNWEASKFYHNHFPKATLYFIKQLLGINFGNEFDDGRPWFEFLDSAKLFCPLYLTLLLIVLFAFLFYLFSIADQLHILDFFLLIASALGLIIYMLDGGLASAPMSIVLFMFFLFFVSRYVKLCETPLQRALLALALSLALNLLSVGVFGYYVPTNSFQMFLVLFVFSVYALCFEIKKTNIKKIGLVKGLQIFFLVLLLIYSFFRIFPTLEVYAFGKMLVDYTELGYTDVQKGSALYIYGLPPELSETELSKFFQRYGEILELNKTGWVAFIRIAPKVSIRDKEIEKALKKEFRPKTYLYVIELAPRAVYESIYVYWGRETNSKKYIRDRFADMKVLRRIEKGEETVLIVEARTGPTWQLLSVLTEIKENGYKGKVLVAK